MTEPAEWVRGRDTWLLYAEFGCFGYLLNGLGSILAPLRRDLGVSRTAVAFYPSLFAAGLLVVGLVGGWLVERLGRVVVRVAGVALLVAGAGLLAVPARPVTLVGAVLLGIGGALLVQLVPALLAALHPTRASAVVAEANAVASAASVLAPLAVGAAIGAGANWRWGYLVLPLAGFALISWARRTEPGVPATGVGPGRAPDAAGVEPGVEPGAEPGSAAGSGAGADGGLDTRPGMRPGPLPGRWLDVLLAVSVEFCLVFWAVSWMTDERHVGPGLAPVLAALFLVGMAMVRAAAGPITSRWPRPPVLVAAGSTVALGGFLLLWAGPGAAVASVGLLVAGLGTALLYPTTVSRVIAAWPHAPDRAAAWAALASGLAIGGVPALLARLADTAGLRTAFLIVPALLLALGGRAALTLAADRVPPASQEA